MRNGKIDHCGTDSASLVRVDGRWLIASLSEQGALRPGLSFEEATDVLWALTSYDLYRMLVVERGWKPARYETWLAQLLIQHLLQPGGE